MTGHPPRGDFRDSVGQNMQRRRRQRRFIPTPAQRAWVIEATASGLAHRAIAAGLRIARQTLETHLASELRAGMAKRVGALTPADRLELLDGLFTAAKRGNVAAQLAYLRGRPEVLA